MPAPGDGDVATLAEQLENAKRVVCPFSGLSNWMCPLCNFDGVKNKAELMEHMRQLHPQLDAFSRVAMADAVGTVLQERGALTDDGEAAGGAGGSNKARSGNKKALVVGDKAGGSSGGDGGGGGLKPLIAPAMYDKPGGKRVPNSQPQELPNDDMTGPARERWNRLYCPEGDCPNVPPRYQSRLSAGNRGSLNLQKMNKFKKDDDDLIDDGGDIDTNLDDPLDTAANDAVKQFMEDIDQPSDTNLLKPKRC